MFKRDLEKAEEPEIKLPTSVGSAKKQESSRKTSTSALLTMPKHLTVWITKNWKILQEMAIPDHLTCLLRNLCAGQEATVTTGHGTTDWFQIRKAVHQGCILSPCLFNLYAGYIMRNTRLEEAQAGIKTAGRNISNLRYADQRSDQISHSVVSDSLRPHDSQHTRPPCPSPTPGVHSDSHPSVSDAIQPSHPLSSPSPLAPNPS